MDLLIVRATDADAGEILTLQRAAYVAEAIAHDSFIPPLVEPLDSVTARITTSLVLAARAGHRLVGTVQGRLVDGTCQVGRLAVVPDLQGRGIGSRLLSELEGRVPGADRFELFTGARSDANVRLYQRLGYTIFDHRPNPDGVPLVYLEKFINRQTSF
jgi:ribosomal protein S18 acetylase RimI-like enzyme